MESMKFRSLARLAIAAAAAVSAPSVVSAQSPEVRYYQCNLFDMAGNVLYFSQMGRIIGPEYPTEARVAREFTSYILSNYRGQFNPSGAVCWSQHSAELTAQDTASGKRSRARIVDAPWMPR